MTNHLTEQNLETLLLSPESLITREKTEAEAHIDRCALCREHWERLQAFYNEVEREILLGPTSRDHAVAERILTPQRRTLPHLLLDLPRNMKSALEKYTEIIEPYRQPLAERFIRYVQLHPVRFATGMSFAVAAIAFSLILLQTAKDILPTSARIKNRVLSVVNKEGEVLWTKDATGMPDTESGSSSPNIHMSRYLTVTDIDGDGPTEVILFGASPGSAFKSDSLYCFEHHGKTRWTSGGGEMIGFGKQEFTKGSSWAMQDFIVVRGDKSSEPRIFASTQAVPYWPGKVFELDPATGKHTQKYWNTGSLGMGIPLDIDADGSQEIVLAGINNAFESACLVVLDPSNLAGCGPTLPEFAPTEVSRGSEKYYILIPRTDLNKTLAPTKYSSIEKLIPLAQDEFIAYTNESFSEEYPAAVLFTFGQDMRVTSVVGSDPFIVSHERLEKEGKLTKKLTSEYWEELKNSVRYWDGERFVGQPVKISLANPVAQPRHPS